VVASATCTLLRGIRLPLPAGSARKNGRISPGGEAFRDGASSLQNCWHDSSRQQRQTRRAAPRVSGSGEQRQRRRTVEDAPRSWIPGPGQASMLKVSQEVAPEVG
jgi:hypothetical protein